MGMNSYETLLDEIAAIMEMKGAYAGVEKLEALKSEGNNDAVTCLGELYLEGIGVIPDAEMGIKLLREASDAGNPHADEMLGRIYIYGSFGQQEDPTRGHPYIERAANKGLPSAMGICACDYFYGEGVTQNPEKGFEWAMRGAKLGDAVSNALCGEAYQTGVGTTADISKAVHHYREALSVNPEDTDVMCSLALCLSDPFNEYGVFPSQADSEESFGLLSKAVEKGDLRAHCLLGALYAGGVGVQQDYDLAHHYIELAASNGFEPAHEMLSQFRRTMRGNWTL